jgi:hypothetical protein
MDLHDVTEKAISLGKERGILQMDDYDEIIGSAEEINEAETPVGMLNRLNPNKSLKVGDITTFLSGKYKGKKVKIVKDLGNSRFELELIGSAEEMGENVAPNHNGKSGKYGSGYKPLEERISEALDSINEELCPAGKAYRKRRIAAGEKSSAYLSGRAVKVCKGQMSGKKKKK